MKIFILLFFTILSRRTEVAALNCACVDYYWRDYCGLIPSDAVIGGYNLYGEPRYVGSVYYTSYESLPATIYPREGVAVATAYDKILNTTDNIRILCSRYPKALQWITIDNKDIDYYRYLNLIPGGSEGGQVLYFGRVFVNGEPLVGKAGMAYPDYANNRPGFSTVYDILYYDCQKA